MVPQFWNLSFYHFPRPDSFWAAGKNFTSLLPPTSPTHIPGVLSLKFSPKSYYLLTVYPDTDRSLISPAMHKNSLAYITLASLPRFHVSPTRMDLPSGPQVGLTSSADLHSSKVKFWVPTVPLCINLRYGSLRAHSLMKRNVHEKRLVLDFCCFILLAHDGT